VCGGGRGKGEEEEEWREGKQNSIKCPGNKIRVYAPKEILACEVPCICLAKMALHAVYVCKTDVESNLGHSYASVFKTRYREHRKHEREKSIVNLLTSEKFIKIAPK